MNQFFLWKTRNDELELVTCPLDGTILPGVTRDSVLSLCREWNNFRVTERHYSIEEVIAAVQEGRVRDEFFFFFLFFVHDCLMPKCFRRWSRPLEQGLLQ